MLILVFQENNLWPVEFIDQATVSNVMTSGYDNDDIMPEYRSDEYYEDDEVEGGQETINEEEL